MNWDLTALYQDFDDPRLAEDFTRAEAALADILAAVDKPALTQADWEGAVDALNAAEGVLSRLGNMIQLTLAADATHPQANALRDKLLALDMADSQVKSALCRLAGADDALEDKIAASPTLSEHAFFLRELRDQAAHTLPAEIEGPVLAMQKTGSRAFEQLRDTLDATHLITLTVDGREQTLPLSAVRGLAYSSDAATRKAAYEAELAAYPRMELPMLACLNSIKGEALTLCDLRGYADPLDHTLAVSRMDRETLDAMIGAMEAYLPAFRKYLKAKARALGHTGGLPFYDLFAPLGDGEGNAYTVEQARQYLVEVLGTFSAKMANFVDNAFAQRWIDMFPRAGKTGGAFCAPVYAIKQSRVLTNFSGDFSSVTTLGHELGHGYHNLCIFENTALNTEYPMPLAETASIFNETLLSHAALKTATGERAKMLLDFQLQEETQVIVDILSRFYFERAFFAARRDHAVSVEEAKAMMIKAQQDTYGDGLDENYLHPYMWACKSHYYSAELNYYNFPYAFGLLFGKGVFAQYLAQGEAFLPRYDQLLASCGRGSVADVARSVGIDVRDAAFWRQSLDEIAGMIDQFDQLV